MFGAEHLDRGAVRVAVACVVLTMTLAVPSLAHACSQMQNSDLTAARRSIAVANAAGNPGAADAAAVVERSRARCGARRFGRAVAQATVQAGIATEGRHVRSAGIDLLGVRRGATVVWRADLVRTAGRLVAARSTRAQAALRLQLRAHAFGPSAAVVWSTDATRPSWNVATQSAMASVLARGVAADRIAGASSVRAFAPTARQRALARVGVLDVVTIASRLELAATRGRSTPARLVAAKVTMHTYRRVRGATQRGWSRVDGHWATLAEHQRLTVSARALLRVRPHLATTAAVTRLAADLTTPTGVGFTTVPAGVFYPWPRDQAFDTQSFEIDVNKPATLTLVMYGADGATLRSIDQTVEPGAVQLTWDGAAASGAILGAGEYRYTINTMDLAGNALPVAGLEEFRIARDTTKPVVKLATLKYLTTGVLGPRLIASWNVEEVHSPNVRTYVILRAGGATRSILLDDRARVNTMRHSVTLPAGKWRASYVFIDGSGNRASQAAGTLTVR